MATTSTSKKTSAPTSRQIGEAKATINSPNPAARADAQRILSAAGQSSSQTSGSTSGGGSGTGRATSPSVSLPTKSTTPTYYYNPKTGTKQYYVGALPTDKKAQGFVPISESAYRSQGASQAKSEVGAGLTRQTSTGSFNPKATAGGSLSPALQGQKGLSADQQRMRQELSQQILQSPVRREYDPATGYTRSSTSQSFSQVMRASQIKSLSPEVEFRENHAGSNLALIDQANQEARIQQEQKAFYNNPNLPLYKQRPTLPDGAVKPSFLQRAASKLDSKDIINRPLLPYQRAGNFLETRGENLIQRGEERRTSYKNLPQKTFGVGQEFVGLVGSETGRLIKNPGATILTVAAIPVAAQYAPNVANRLFQTGAAYDVATQPTISGKVRSVARTAVGVGLFYAGGVALGEGAQLYNRAKPYVVAKGTQLKENIGLKLKRGKQLTPQYSISLGKAGDVKMDVDILSGGVKLKQQYVSPQLGMYQQTQYQPIIQKGRVALSETRIAEDVLLKGVQTQRVKTYNEFSKKEGLTFPSIDTTSSQPISGRISGKNKIESLMDAKKSFQRLKERVDLEAGTSAIKRETLSIFGFQKTGTLEPRGNKFYATRSDYVPSLPEMKMLPTPRPKVDTTQPEIFKSLFGERGERKLFVTKPKTGEYFYMEEIGKAQQRSPLENVNRGYPTKVRKVSITPSKAGNVKYTPSTTFSSGGMGLVSLSRQENKGIPSLDVGGLFGSLSGTRKQRTFTLTQEELFMGSTQVGSYNQVSATRQRNTNPTNIKIERPSFLSESVGKTTTTRGGSRTTVRDSIGSSLGLSTLPASRTNQQTIPKQNVGNIFGIDSKVTPRQTPRLDVTLKPKMDLRLRPEVVPKPFPEITGRSTPTQPDYFNEVPFTPFTIPFPGGFPDGGGGSSERRKKGEAGGRSSYAPTLYGLFLPKVKASSKLASQPFSPFAPRPQVYFGRKRK